MTLDLQVLAGELAGIISLCAFGPYVREILRGQTRPNRATWWVWTVIGATLCASYYESGARDSVWVPLTYVVGPLVIALLSIRYGEGGVDLFDRACLIACVLSLPAWWLARSALVALVANIAIDLCGALPTIRKTYQTPGAESLVAWSMFLVADALNLGAIGTWTVAAAYPLYLFLLAGVLVGLMIRPRTVRLVTEAKIAA